MEHNIKKKIALVAGGAGFIGSHLCDRLIKDDYRVICLDNLYTGRIENIAHHFNDPNFEFINQDVVEPIKINNLSVIFNLACPASPKQYQKDAIYTTKTSVLGTINMLDLATINKCPILQASTSEVYGDPLVHPQPEKYCGNVNPIGIRACYDEGKRCAESLCMDYYRQYGTQIKIVRIFNTYGPRMATDDGRVVSNIVNQAIKGEDITIYGDGSQTRSFLYIDDLINAFAKMLLTPVQITGPVNLGNPVEMTINGIARIIKRLAHSNSRIVYWSLPQDDPQRRNLDISLAKRILDGWKPQVHVEEGFTKVIHYFTSLQTCITDEQSKACQGYVKC